MASPKAMLFDLDGVLVSSQESWFLTVEEAGQVFRGRRVSREEFEPTFGQGTEADAQQFGLGCTAEALNRFYLEHFPRFAKQAQVNPDAREVLDRLAKRGIRRAVVTNTASPLAFAVLGAVNLLGHFEWIACADHVRRAKPAPDLVLHAAQRLEVPIEGAWLVGDSRFDREAALAAGVRFIGLGIDGEPRIERLAELLALVERAGDHS